MMAGCFFLFQTATPESVAVSVVDYLHKLEGGIFAHESTSSALRRKGAPTTLHMHFDDKLVGLGSGVNAESRVSVNG